LKSKSKLKRTKPKILGIIPARGGSKGIKNKNIQNLRGRPLIGWAVKAVAGSRMIDQVWVSTDDDEIGRITIEYGGRWIKRPYWISSDKSRDIEFLKHSVQWVKQNEGFEPDIVAWFPPDCPIRTSQDVDEVLRYMVKKNLDSVRTAIEAPVHPFKMWVKKGDGKLVPLSPFDPGVPRQELPLAFIPFGMVNATKVQFIKDRTLWGKKLEFYMVEARKYLDIDTPEQLEKAQVHVREFGIK